MRRRRLEELELEFAPTSPVGIGIENCAEVACWSWSWNLRGRLWRLKAAFFHLVVSRLYILIVSFVYAYRLPSYLAG